VSFQERTNGLREEFEAHLGSPLTLLGKVRRTIFGSEDPDTYTKFSFFFALAGWGIFFLWSVLGTVAIRSREFIIDNKEIDLRALLEARAAKLGYETASFISRLETFYTLSVALWFLVFVGLVLMWRRKMIFAWFFFGGVLLYLILMWAMLGFSYFRNDTTLFDKVALFVLIAHTAVYAYILSQEQNGRPIRLFGLDPED
jgi:hypothetical protein